MRAAVRDLPGGIPPAGHVLRAGKPEEADRQGGPGRLLPLLLPGMHAGVLFDIPVELRAAQSVRAEGPLPCMSGLKPPFPLHRYGYVASPWNELRAAHLVRAEDPPRIVTLLHACRCTSTAVLRRASTHSCPARRRPPRAVTDGLRTVM